MRSMYELLTPRVYRALTTLLSLPLRAAIVAAGSLRPAQQRRFRHMRGLYREDEIPAANTFDRDSPRIWMHAVSVGEVGLAFALIRAYHKAAPERHASFIITTTTVTGQARAIADAPQGVTVLHFPLDTPIFVKRALQRIKPTVLALLETELWPNLIATTHEMGIPVVVLNGRISPRSFTRYRKLNRLVPPILHKVQSFTMIHAEDQQRIIEIGAPAGRVRVGGNAKFDDLPHRREMTEPKLPATRAMYGIHEDDWVFVAGCTRRGEEQFVVDIYRELNQTIPSLRFIWAPRHPQYTPALVQLLRGNRIQFSLRSQTSREQPAPRLPNLVLVDQIGELFQLYGVADAAFSGGSLIPHGGHNILEVAVWDTPPIYGPSHENFPDAHHLLTRHQACIRVENPAGVAQAAIDLYRKRHDSSIWHQRCREAISELGTHSRQQAEALIAVTRQPAQRS